MSTTKHYNEEFEEIRAKKKERYEMRSIMRSTLNGYECMEKIQQDTEKYTESNQYAEKTMTEIWKVLGKQQEAGWNMKGDPCNSEYIVNSSRILY